MREITMDRCGCNCGCGGPWAWGIRKVNPGRDVSEDLEDYRERLENEITLLEKKLARVRAAAAAATSGKQE
jgi:hypothetical protein